MAEEVKGGNVPFKDIEFRVSSEPWNVYQLEDGTVLKQKYILTRVLIQEHGDNIEFRLAKQMITVATKVREHLCGPPTDPLPPKEDWGKYVSEENVSFTTKEEEWNQYVLENGFTLRIKSTLNIVSRTSLRNADWEPIYIAHSSEQVLILPPAGFRKKK